MEDKLFNALSEICSYNCHYEWLIKLGLFINELPKEKYSLLANEVNDINENIATWDTEEHFIWMMLVSMFGNWGTSIRSGWLELKNKNEIVVFLKKLIKDCYFHYDSYETFNCVNENDLTEEQFNILKEWLDNDE